MNTETQTLIIGGGISGLAAARKLYEEKRNFGLVTDHLGGRMYHSQDFSMNFGATYITEEYHHVKKFVGKGKKLRLNEVYSEDKGILKKFLSPKTIKYTPQLFRLLQVLLTYKKNLNNFRKEAEFELQDKVLPRYPFLQELLRLRMTDFIKKYDLYTLDKLFLRQTIGATAFLKFDEAQAWAFLNPMLPILIDTWYADYRETYKKLSDGFEKRITFNKITSLIRQKDGTFIAGCADNTKFSSENLILAAPAHNISQFYKVPAPDLTKPAKVYYVKGERKEKFKKSHLTIFNPEQSPVVLLWRIKEEVDLVIAFQEKNDLYEFYENFTITGENYWKKATIFIKDRFLEMNPEKNIYLAGDYNICGLEDCYISGLCAANQIIGV